MIGRYLWLYLTTIIFSAVLVSKAWASTDQLDVKALEDLFKALNYPSQLKGWRPSGGDPCGQSWTGVLCSGSSVLYLSLHGLGLRGSFGSQLQNMHSLKELDMSSNSIEGEIPYGLPPNATHLNLAYNNLSQSIPGSLPLMKNLRHMNLSHNSLSGPVGNFFTDLQNLRELDLSYNNFSGDLPSSFGSLKNLIGLFLQKNEFTGSVIFLSELPLNQLNIQDNNFSGVIPNHFKTIPNLWIGGNRFTGHADYPPWSFPLENLPEGGNITLPPTSESSAIKTFPSDDKVHVHKKKRLSRGGLAFMICGGTLLATCAALFFVIRSNRLNGDNLETGHGSLDTHPVTQPKELSSTAQEESPQVSPVSSPMIRPPTHLLPPVTVRHGRAEKTPRKKSFSKKRCVPLVANAYTLSELQSATCGFSEENLLGEGSLGSVYRAESPDGKILAVKTINLVSLTVDEEEQFLDVIWTASRLSHPNIIKLVGYCIEDGQHILVYEYVRNLSLDEALHGEAYKPLSWCVRLWVALGVARALDYMHTTISPPVAHNGIKAANILLDEELTPHLSDCGLASLRPLLSNEMKEKASEIADEDTGYVASEHGEPGSDDTKSDIYAFGVLLLELLTGRKPFDSSRSVEEQSLVKWASSQLHDSESLTHMVDQGIKKTLSSRAISQFADIISLCIQPVKEFRPPMSEILDSLTSMLRKPSMVRSGGASDGAEADPCERSFRSTHTGFMGSPALSYLSS